jgi:hypothetical protein
LSASLRYAGTALAGCALVTLALWPFLDPEARRGIVIAAAIALPVQIGAFALLIRYRDNMNGFLAIWAGGTLVRMAVVGITAVIVIRSGAAGAVPMLLGLAGFFFGLLLLEPIYFRSAAAETT